MNQAATSNLAAALWPASGASAPAAALRMAVLAAAGVAVLAASAKIQIPFWPVPMTLQTMVVMLIGLTYGLRLGSLTVLSYLALGALGAPVFASGAGFAYLLGPTGGFLAGMLVAALVMGALGDRGWGRSFWSLAAALAAGTAVIFLLGIAWLSTIIGLEKAIAAGLYPFFLSELVKLAVAAKAMPMVWRLVDRQRRSDRG